MHAHQRIPLLFCSSSVSSNLGVLEQLAHPDTTWQEEGREAFTQQLVDPSQLSQLHIDYSAIATSLLLLVLLLGISMDR